MSDRGALVAALAEVFRAHGYEGASLAAIAGRTGLGKGSLYHHFPGGKAEMAGAVLDSIEAWFEAEVFQPLRTGADPAAAIRATFAACDGYFRSGGRVCLVGAFALGTARDRFAARIDGYFATWRNALAGALQRAGWSTAEAEDLAEDVVGGIQGALVLARAVDDAAVFGRALHRLAGRCAR